MPSQFGMNGKSTILLCTMTFANLTASAACWRHFVPEQTILSANSIPYSRFGSTGKPLFASMHSHLPFKVSFSLVFTVHFSNFETNLCSSCIVFACIGFDWMDRIPGLRGPQWNQVRTFLRPKQSIFEICKSNQERCVYKPWSMEGIAAEREQYAQ